jgi:hypothetical protein
MHRSGFAKIARRNTGCRPFIAHLMRCMTDIDGFVLGNAHGARDLRSQIQSQDPMTLADFGGPTRSQKDGAGERGLQR